MGSRSRCVPFLTSQVTSRTVPFLLGRSRALRWARMLDLFEEFRALVAGLEGSGKPLIHTSGASVVGDDARGQASSGPVFDEDTPLAVDPRKQARRDIDLHVLAAATRGARSAVICRRRVSRARSWSTTYRCSSRRSWPSSNAQAE